MLDKAEMKDIMGVGKWDQLDSQDDFLDGEEELEEEYNEIKANV